jgi:hypothetical protein
MASQVLSQQATSDTLYASGGVVSGGNVTSGADVGGVRGAFNQLIIRDTDPDDTADAGLFLFSFPPTQVPPAAQLFPQEVITAVPSNNLQNLTPECLNVYIKDTASSAVIVQKLVSSQVPARGLVGPPVVAGDRAIYGLVSTAQSGRAAMAATTSAVVIANTAVTANTVVMVTVEGAAPDTTATSFSVAMGVGVGFTIHANAAATADTTLQWFIVHY